MINLSRKFLPAGALFFGLCFAPNFAHAEAEPMYYETNGAIKIEKMKESTVQLKNGNKTLSISKENIKQVSETTKGFFVTENTVLYDKDKKPIRLLSIDDYLTPIETSDVPEGYQSVKTDDGTEGIIKTNENENLDKDVKKNLNEHPVEEKNNAKNYLIKNDNGTEFLINKEVIDDYDDPEDTQTYRQSSSSSYDSSFDEPVPDAAYDGDTASQVVAYSYKFLGAPYVWGAMGPHAYDCSGFVGTVYRHFGYSLPRTSADMSTVGTTISPSNMQPGDLVFFNRGGGSRVSHVGMYVGGGQFIHASRSKGKVIVAPTSTSYFRNHLVRVKRVI